MANLAFTRKTTADGKANVKYVDLLEEDKTISGQKFVCVSFVSPENVLIQKNHFFFQEFLKHYDFSKSVKKFHQYLNFISFKYNIQFDDLMGDFEEFVKTEQDSFDIEGIKDEYKNFMDANEENLEDEFGKVHNFQTSVRGLKVRGSYSTQEEAELRCKLLREVDPNHNVYVGPVGMWMPWEPEAYKTGKVEYLEEELNELMSEKIKNEEKAKQEFEKRILETKRKAIEENVKLARETGNKLTQNIDKEGNLYGVNNTIEENLKTNGDEITSADIKKELFEGSNIVTSSMQNEPKLKSNLKDDEL
jgi:hypothetical protein